ncbi:MAG: NUDIX domain-containing protein [Terracidiphilus sp.]
MQEGIIRVRSANGNHLLEVNRNAYVHDDRAVTLDGAPIGSRLRQLVFRSLVFLLDRRNSQVTYEDLATEVWQAKIDTLDQKRETIRKTIGELAFCLGGDWIQHEPSIGFTFHSQFAADPLPLISGHSDEIRKITGSLRNAIKTTLDLQSVPSTGLPAMDFEGVGRIANDTETGSCLNTAYWGPNNGLRSEVLKYFEARRIAVNGMGWCVCLADRAEVDGWAENEVRFSALSRYELPGALNQMIQEFPFPADAKANDVYSLLDYSDLLTDEDTPLVISALPVSYATECSFLDGASIQEGVRGKYRSACEDLFSLKRSVLAHVLAAHVVVLTNEPDGSRRLLLNRRSDRVKFFPKSWSVSIEEHTLARHSDGRTRADDHPWDTARRGLREELGITASEIVKLRLMGLYLEFNIWTVAMVFIAECSASFRTIVQRWASALDRHESRVVDSVPATVQTIDRMLSCDEWAPSDSAWYIDDRQREREADLVVAGQTVSTPYHNTSALRLAILRKHLSNAERS